VSFLQQLDATALSISAEDFDRGMRECQEQARLDMKRTLSNASGNGRQTSASFDAVNGGVSDPKASLSIRQVREMRLEREGQKGTSGGPGRAGAGLGAAVDVGAVASMPDALHDDVRGNNGGGGGIGILKAPVPKATSIRSRYRFLSRSPDDMTIKEIPALLKDYQQLVYLCEQLLSERESQLAATRP